jgi:glycerol-3-phosphate dehydrogenase
MIGVNSLIWKEEPDRLRVTEKEVTDFLEEINEADPRLQLGMDDVALVMAGLLPVERGDSEGGDVSFGKRPLVVDNAKADGIQSLVTAVANRYTVARGVAQRAVDIAYRKLGREPRPCRTETTRVHGGDFGRFEDLLREVTAALPPGTDPAIVDRLARDHGSAYGEVTRVIDERPDWGKPVPGTDVLRAEVVHTARSEMVTRLGDCVFGRLGIGTVGDPGLPAIEEVASLLADQLGWDSARRAAEIADVQARFPFRRM